MGDLARYERWSLILALPLVVGTGCTESGPSTSTDLPGDVRHLESTEFFAWGPVGVAGSFDPVVHSPERRTPGSSGTRQSRISCLR